MKRVVRKAWTVCRSKKEEDCNCTFIILVNVRLVCVLNVFLIYHKQQIIELIPTGVIRTSNDIFVKCADYTYRCFTVNNNNL